MPQPSRPDPPPTTSPAVTVAKRLQAALRDHGLAADVFPLDPDSGRVTISVARGLRPITDGEHIWWTIPGPGWRSKPRMAVYRTPHLAAARLAAQAAAQQPDRLWEPRDASPQ